MTDSLGLPLTFSNPKVPIMADAFRDEFLGFGLNMVNVIEDILAIEPENVYANSIMAFLQLYGDHANIYDNAAPYIQKCASSVENASLREQLLYQAAERATQREYEQCIVKLKELVTKFPRDVVSGKLLSDKLFWFGRQQEIEEYLAIVFNATKEDSPLFYGFYAFILEERGRLEEAEAIARKGIELKRKNPWAHHALAHVFESTSRYDEAVQFLEEISPEWDGCITYLLSHMWWHLALCYQDKGDYKKALEIYDKYLRVVSNLDVPQETIQLAALLYLLETRQHEVGPERWDELGKHITQHTADNIMPFLDVHYSIALGRCAVTTEQDAYKESLNELLSNVKKRLERAKEYEKEWWSIAVPTTEAFAAAGLGETARAGDIFAANFKPETYFETMIKIGGSHPQRDIFHFVYIPTMIATGRYNEALTVLSSIYAEKKKNVAFYQEKIEHLKAELAKIAAARESN